MHLWFHRKLSLQSQLISILFNSALLYSILLYMLSHSSPDEYNVMRLKAYNWDKRLYFILFCQMNMSNIYIYIPVSSVACFPVLSRSLFVVVVVYLFSYLLVIIILPDIAFAPSTLFIMTPPCFVLCFILLHSVSGTAVYLGITKGALTLTLSFNQKRNIFIDRFLFCQNKINN